MCELAEARWQNPAAAGVDFLLPTCTDRLLPLLVGTLIVVWVLTATILLLWFIRRRRKSGSTVGSPTGTVEAQLQSLEDNNALHNSTVAAAAREQLNHIQNPIQRAAAKNWLNDARATGKLGDENQERDKRLQKPRLPRASPPPYSLVEWAAATLQTQPLGKQDNRQRSRTEFLL